MIQLLIRLLVAPFRSSKRRAALLGIAVAVGVLLGSTVEAQAAPRVLRPGTRPWVFLGGLGFTGNFWVDYGGYSYRGYRSRLHQFKLMQDIGGHFSGDASGPALGASFEESFNGDFWRLQAGPKFWWDIQVVKSMGIYVTPEVRIGPAVWGNGDAHGFFNQQIGCSGRLILADRAIVFFKPISVDLFTDFDGWWFGYWDVMAGGGVTW
ncbi:MAG: hypothetical protein JRI23_00230 [Deltaproteobacteria bacterium]|jgi:hypothetical protein|nr:hypothetical protein [Deltaproteobacteria bacterium]MBW2529868.1 hypothetical protein [Deltaproteobacteria bacterium]